MEKDGSFTEINKAAINYKPVLHKAEVKNKKKKHIKIKINLSLNFILLIWEMENGKRLYESKNFLSSHLKIFALFVCCKNNCHRTSKTLAILKSMV